MRVVVASGQNETIPVRGVSVAAPTSLGDLQDVNTTGVVDGAVMVWDAATGYWTVNTAIVTQESINSTIAELPRITANTAAPDAPRFGDIWIDMN